MSCCAEPNVRLVEPQPAGWQRDCPACQKPGRAVTRRTMLLMLKPELFDEVGERQFCFCAAPACPVVYFSSERCFTTGELRTRVGLKETEEPIPLCYCFGFDEQALRAEIEAKGHTTIPQRIAALVKERLCACEERNPAGACCLGDVTKAVKRLLKEAR